MQQDLINKISEKQMMVFMLLCEVINFCFWPETNWKFKYNNIYHGSAAMFLSMKKEIEENPSVFDIENLKNITYEKFCDIFKTIDKPICFLDLRYKNFKQVAHILEKKGDKFYDEIYSKKSDIELLKYIVKTFSCFDDYSWYKFRKIKFYKRATLLVRDYYQLVPTVANNIKNISNLSACADYVVPNLLRNLNVLKYNKSLSKIVDRKKEIRHNSIMEIEIRANMIWAVELLKKELLKNGKKVDSVILDGILWKYGESSIKSTPHHRTRTIFY